MEASALTKIIAPLVLALMMIGMGLSLVKDDFKRVLLYPKAVGVGTLGQMIILPLIAFALVSVLPMQPEIAVGVMVLACCPGGPGSNLVALLCRGDAALSVSLTAVSSLLASFTIPLIVHFATGHFLNQQAELEFLKLLDMGVKVCILTLVPVFIGMFIRNKAPEFAAKSEQPVKLGSVVFLVILVVSIGFKEKGNLLSLLEQAGLVGALLCVCTMGAGFLMARLAQLNLAQSRSIMIEVGIQNAALALMITTVMLNSTAAAIPAAVYSPVMLTISGLLIAYFTFINKK